MTGANRLLIGLGWSMVVFIAWYRLRRTGTMPPGRWEGIELTRDHSIELGFLWVATLYSLTLPLKSSITLIDTVVLVGLFAAYTWRVSRAPAEEPHLVGPARYLGSFPVAARRASVIGLFAASGAVIWLFAHPFAEALVEEPASSSTSASSSSCSGSPRSRRRRRSSSSPACSRGVSTRTRPSERSSPRR